MYQLMIAGTKSGVGKTTVSMGLMAALSKRMTVQPYKVGPDYIDPAFHSYITGRTCRNLDSYILPEDMIHYFYEKNLQKAEVALVEGVMGLFDGAEVGSDIGTSASIAKMLNLPVILVVDGSKVAASLAATVKGFDTFDPKLRMAGVIINNVGSEAHYEILKKAIEMYTEVKPCGYLLKNSQITLPERHLGLVPASEQLALDEVFETLAEAIEATVDIETILSIGQSQTPEIQAISPKVFNEEKVRIGIAKDKAFNFYYEDALDLMEELGHVEWVPFSPLIDSHLPENISGLYFGGGFPEVFADQLAENNSFINDLLKHLGEGMPYTAECGGLMYLCDGLVDLEGGHHQMVGWLPGETVMTKRLQRFGYAELTLDAPCIFGSKGQKIRIHEFHRSSAEVALPNRYAIEKIRYGQVIKSWQCGFEKGNGIAAYAHMHYGSNLQFAENFVRNCLTYKERG